jgi:hypothetical protein
MIAGKAVLYVMLAGRGFAKVIYAERKLFDISGRAGEVNGGE